MSMSMSISISIAISMAIAISIKKAITIKTFWFCVSDESGNPTSLRGGTTRQTVDCNGQRDRV